MAYLYKFSSLVTEIQKKSKDLSFSSDLIMYYLQDIQDSVLAHGGFPFDEDSTQETLNIGDNSYNKDKAIQLVESITITDPITLATKQLIYKPFRVFNDYMDVYKSFPAGCPDYFTDFGGQFIFERSLDKAYILTIQYITTQKSISLTDTPIIPYSFKQIYVLGGLAEVEEYRENFDKAAVYRRRMEDAIEDMGTRLNPRQLITLSKATRKPTRRIGIRR
jgi:hypothetical protein